MKMTGRAAATVVAVSLMLGLVSAPAHARVDPGSGPGSGSSVATPTNLPPAPRLSEAPRKVTALVPVKSIFNVNTYKTKVLKHKRKKVTIRIVNGVVYAKHNSNWAPVAYRYLPKWNTIVFHEVLRYDNLGIADRDILGGVRPRYIGTGGEQTKKPAPEETSNPSGPKPPVASLTGQEQQALDQINNRRERNGAGPLKPCKNLNSAADSWSRLLVEQDYGMGLAIIDEYDHPYRFTDMLDDTSGYNRPNNAERWNFSGKSKNGALPAEMDMDQQFFAPKHTHIGIGSFANAEGHVTWTVTVSSGGNCW